uniref:Cation-transporting P-type ATPase N-terminal domain-containing protein n=2 Tax=Plectus sambesii TaxID=2011161 RepID=A0A914VQD1_9BILA
MSSKMVKRRSRPREMSDESLDQLAGQARRTPRATRSSRSLNSPSGSYGSTRVNVVHRSSSSKDQMEQIVASSGAHIIRKIGRAFFARMLFVVHSLTTIWQTVEVYDNQAYWSFALISVAILIEGSYTILVRAGDERKWFCPSVLLFILATAPPIWLLETDMSRRRFDVHFGGNETTRALVIKRERERLGARSGVSEAIGAPITPKGSFQEPRLQLESAFRISHELWVQLLEQFLLVILIIGRWMLPKGEITREQLSQILLAYLAIASDIVS